MDDKKTMTAEEVEKDVEAVKASLYAWGVSAATARSHDALSRLAAQAARVPGLEEELHGDRYAIFGALMWSGMWPMGVEKLKPSRHVSALLERLQQSESESERDAARKEVEGATRELRARTVLAESDRDMAKGEVEVLRGQLKEARKDAGEAVAAYQDLRERVATLEEQLANHKTAVDGLEEQWEKQKARAEGRADVMVAVLKLVDPNDANHWNGDGVLKEVARNAEDAAKYRAAVERAGDVATLAKVSFEAWRSHTRPPSKLTEEQAQASAVARYVLGLNGSTPAPRPTLDKARVVEVLRDIATARDMLAALHDGATRLGLTLATPPSGPGGGNPKAVNREAFDKVYGEAAKRWDAAFDRYEAKARARIAPTPTPEVPPLVESPPDTSSVGAEYSQGFGDGWTKRGARMRLAMSSRDVAMRRLLGAVGKLVSVYSEISGESPAETAASFEPTPETPPLKMAGIPIVADSSVPEGEAHLRTDSATVRIVNVEPTAPVVVWQGDGLKVYANGTYSCDPEVLEKSVDGLLARALAEAKREAREALVPATEAARLGAGAMRERAAEAAKTARHSVVIDESFNTYAKACEDIERRIRALPLEAP